MKPESLVAVIVAIVCIILFTMLLVFGQLNQTFYVLLLSILGVVCLCLHGFSRLREVDLKNFKLVLAEVKEVQAKIEKLYSDIEHLKRTPMTLDDKKMAELGLNNGFAPSSAVMRYTSGCIKRERERLARIFVKEHTPDDLAQAILDASLDEKVFKWNGPETSLDVPPKQKP